MRRFFCWGVLVTGLALLLPSGSLGQKKDKSKDVGTPATKQDYAQLIQHKELVGKIVQYDAESKEITILAEFKRLEPKPGAEGKLTQEQQRIQQEIVREQQRIARIRNPIYQAQEYNRFLARMQQK